MDSNNIVNSILWLCIIITGIMLFINPIKKIIKFILNGLLGIFIIYLFNILLPFIELNVGINIFTFIISALLGIPGVIAIFVIQFIL